MASGRTCGSHGPLPLRIASIGPRARNRVLRVLVRRIGLVAPPEGYPEVRARLSRQFIRGQGLEIGGLNAPLPVPKADRVSYIDRWTIDELRSQYPELAEIKIIGPDILDDGETLSTIADGSVDFVIANHFLEHTQNVIQTIRNHLRVVRPAGVLFYAVPDKRFTFDHDRPVTPLEHFVRDYTDGPEWSYEAHIDEWVAVMHEGSAEARARIVRDALSIHYHVWTAGDFLELITDCRRQLDVSFEIEAFERIGHEFIVVLSKTDAPAQAAHEASPRDARLTRP